MDWTAREIEDWTRRALEAKAKGQSTTYYEKRAQEARDKAAWETARAKVMREASPTDRCFYCGNLLVDTKGVHPSRRHLDHKVPQAKGGTHARENLVWSCQTCNTEKGKKSIDEYRRYLVLCEVAQHSGYFRKALTEELYDWLVKLRPDLSVEARGIEITFYGEQTDL